MKKIVFTEEQKEQIKNLYLNDNFSLKKIADTMGVSRPVITNFLRDEGIDLRQRTHQYKANYDIFEVIDNAEKAYWLGFIAADGCNYQRENNASIIISIHQKDREHLERFKAFVETEAEIVDFVQTEGFSNNTPMCKIVLNSKKMSQDLVDKGIPPKKSLILKPPKISEEFYLPFILGYFDGDGSVSYSEQHNSLSLSIQGTKELLEWINSILNISERLEQRNPGSEKNSYYIRCGGTNKPISILNKLYESCSSFYLKRKHLVFTKIFTSRP